MEECKCGRLHLGTHCGNSRAQLYTTAPPSLHLTHCAVQRRYAGHSISYISCIDLLHRATKIILWSRYCTFSTKSDITRHRAQKSSIFRLVSHVMAIFCGCLTVPIPNLGVYNAKYGNYGRVSTLVYQMDGVTRHTHARLGRKGTVPFECFPLQGFHQLNQVQKSEFTPSSYKHPQPDKDTCE